METMYPAIPISPMTTLAGAIDGTQTSIDVADASVLPAAPNLATIGNGEDAEVILYTGKSTNTLTGITRGFEGTAKAWDADTTVARMLTAWDLNSIQNNFAAHLAETVSKTILITEPYNQVTQTTINLGFRPKSIAIDAGIVATKYQSRGYSDGISQSCIFNVVSLDYLQFANNLAIVFRNTSGISDQITGVITVTDTGFTIDWAMSGSLTGASGDRRYIVSATTHGGD